MPPISRTSKSVDVPVIERISSVNFSNLVIQRCSLSVLTAFSRVCLARSHDSKGGLERRGRALADAGQPDRGGFLRLSLVHRLCCIRISA